MIKTTKILIKNHNSKNGLHSKFNCQDKAMMFINSWIWLRKVHSNLVLLKSLTRDKEKNSITKVKMIKMKNKRAMMNKIVQFPKSA